MKTRPLKFIKNYIGHPANYLSALIGVLIMALTLTFRTDKIHMWILGVCVIALLFVIWGLIIALFNERDRLQTAGILLDLRRFLIDPTGRELMILEPNNILSLDVLVDVYYTDHSYEAPIAIGKVINIQQNDLQQVELIEWFAEDILKIELMHNNFNYIKKVVIKPKFKKDGGNENE